MPHGLRSRIRLPDGFEFSVPVPNNDPVAINSFLAIAESLGQIGITMDVRQVDPGEWLDVYFGHEDLGAQFMSYFPDYADPANYPYLFYYSGNAVTNGLNGSNYRNNEVDAAIETALESTDTEERAQALEDAIAQAQEDVATVPIHWPTRRWRSATTCVSMATTPSGTTSRGRSAGSDRHSAHRVVDRERLESVLALLDRVRHPVDISFTHRGDALAVAVFPAHLERGASYESRIWRVPLDGDTPEQLTAGPRTDSLPTWSPADDRLAFAAERPIAGRMSPFLLEPGGEPTPLGDVNGSVQGLAWSADGTSVFAVAVDEGEFGAATDGAIRLRWSDVPIPPCSGRTRAGGGCCRSTSKAARPRRSVPTA